MANYCISSANDNKSILAILYNYTCKYYEPCTYNIYIYIYIHIASTNYRHNTPCVSRTSGGVAVWQWRETV